MISDATRSLADGETKNPIDVGRSDVTGHPDGHRLSRRHMKINIFIWAAISFHQSACTLIDGEHVDQICNQSIEAIGAKMKKNYHML
ncbi:hypothetical protein Plhal304r1_c054g0138601 [Plasmopara halstedii]